MKRNIPFIWAHRGASGYAPENTIAAFKKAIELKADGIEFDVQMTKDGQLVVIHDETLERVSGIKGWVKDYNLEELKNINVNLNFKEQGKMYIPTLEEVLLLIKENDLEINVELKNGVVFYENIEEKTISLLKKMNLSKRAIISSFNHYSVLKAKELEPDLRVAFIFSDGYIDMPKYGKKYEVYSLHPALYNIQYPEFLNKCKENKIKVNTWTVNEEKYFILAYEMGIDGIFTNYPDLAREVMSRHEVRL